MEKTYRVLLALLKGQFGRNRSVVVDDATLRKASAIGKFHVIEALEDTVFTTLIIDNMYEEDGTTPSTYYAGKTLEAGSVIYGLPHTIQLASGAVRLHAVEELNVT